MSEHVGHLLQKWLAANPNVSEGSVDADQIMWFRKWLNDPDAGPATRILEIGFNAGLSAATFLDSRPNTRLISIDIGAHDYVLRAKAWIDRVWPGRHTLIIGDSASVLQSMIAQFPEYKPDIIFVDGGHQEREARLDLENAWRMAKPETWIVLDDVMESEPGVVAALKYMLSKNKFVVLGQFKTPNRGWVLLKKIGDWPHRFQG